MRGFALVDDYPVGVSVDMCELTLNRALHPIVAGDMIALAATVDAPMRNGFARVESATRLGKGEAWTLRFCRSLTHSIPAATGYDAVFVATALGEHAFDPAPPDTIQ